MATKNPMFIVADPGEVPKIYFVYTNFNDAVNKASALKNFGVTCAVYQWTQKHYIFWSR